jgi:phage terminase small subunit
MHSLTPKQRRFVEEYLVDLNATRAAQRAGYSPQSAGKIASQLLGKTRIQEAIATAQADLSLRVNIRQEQVVQTLAAIAFADISDYVDCSQEPWRLRPLSSLTRAQRQALAHARQRSNGFELRLHSKVRALILLAKHLGMF